ncbi:MAG: hypothetical protein WC119_01705 [Synergistaceae bacterium]
MTKIVTYFSRTTIFDYMMSFTDEKVVKTSIISLSNVVTSEFMKPSKASAYIISRRGFVMDKIVEGEVVRVPMLRVDNKTMESAISAIESFLESENGQFELMCFLRPSHFGIALVEYYSPENWLI